MTTPAPWEASCYDSTRALSLYTIMSAHSLFNQPSILAFFNGVEQTHGSPDTISAGYGAAGIAFLVAGGFVTFDGTSISPTRTIAGGSLPAPIRRVPHDDTRLEFVP